LFYYKEKGKLEVQNRHLKFDKEQRCGLVANNKQKSNMVQFGNCVYGSENGKHTKNVTGFCPSNFRRSFVVNSTTKMLQPGKNDVRGIICGV
jgi:hypothetical protein